MLRDSLQWNPETGTCSGKLILDGDSDNFYRVEIAVTPVMELVPAPAARRKPRIKKANRAGTPGDVPAPAARPQEEPRVTAATAPRRPLIQL